MRTARSITILSLAVCLLSLSGALADAPDEINYQGLLTDATGMPQATGLYRIEFRLYTTATGGSAIWTRNTDNVEVVDGYFNLVIPMPSEIDGDLYAGISVGACGTCAAGAEISPRQQLLSAPFARSSQDLVGPVRTSNLSNGTGRLFVDGPNGNPNVELSSSVAPDNDFGFLGVSDDTGTARSVLAASPFGYGRNYLLGVNGQLNINHAAFGSSGTNRDFGYSNWIDNTGTAKHNLGVWNNGAGHQQTYGAGSSVNYQLSWNGSGDHGVSRWYDDAGLIRTSLGVAAAGEGYLLLYGPNGDLNHRSQDSADHGFSSWHDATGTQKAAVGVRTNGTGYTSLNGANGNLNVLIGELTAGFPNNGALAVMNSGGSTKAGIQVNAVGQGLVYGDVKNFVAEHPSRSGTKIVYASLEGPEIAMYVRGKARLEGGRARIEIPEHFHVLAEPGTMTIHLTPHSLQSKGVAVSASSETFIEIGELFEGRGSYEVSYEIKAERSGFDNYRPVMNRDEFSRWIGEVGAPAAVPSTPENPATLELPDSAGPVALEQR